MDFFKYQGLGNDFVILDRRGGGTAPSPKQASLWCDRHFGIGADGILTLLPQEGADAFMHIVNSDGSIPEMCGNGLRCVVAYLGELMEQRRFTIGTGAGHKTCSIHGTGQIETALGNAQIVRRELSVPGVEQAMHISTGNPHLVCSASGDLAQRAAELAGRSEVREIFPHGVNVGCLQAEANGLRLVVFERGAGLTMACGTGAAAAATAAKVWGMVPADGSVKVTLPGGDLEILHDSDGGIRQRGPAKFVFRGSL